MGFIDDLKERRLVQVVVSYLAAGWIATEVVNSLADRGVVPNVVYLVALVWFVAGIPAALLIGWNHGEKGRQRAPKSELVLLAILAILTLGASGWTIARSGAPDVDLDDFGLPRSNIAVMQFEDVTPGGEYQHIANGLADRLRSELERVSGLDVASAAGVRQYEQAGVSRDSLARALQAGTLVGGTVEHVDDGLEVTVALYDGDSGMLYPDGRIRLEPRPVDEILEVQEAMVEEAADLLRTRLGTEVRLRRRARETNETAWLLVQRADELRRRAERTAGQDLNAALGTLEEAHTLLEQAARADTAWADPWVLRAQIELRAARLVANRPAAVEEHVGAGVRFANEALEREPRNAEAFDKRGQLLFWKHQLNIESDPAVQQALRERAREDLERAVELTPQLAEAYNTLSIIYYDESRSRAMLAARRAYEEDPFMEAADVALWRLYVGNLDMELWRESERACEEGARRFPDNFRFVYCQLQLMTTPAVEPDPDRARHLGARLDSVAPPGIEAYLHMRGRLDVAGTLARTATTGSAVDSVLLDSARTMLDRIGNEISRDDDLGEDLIWMQAYMRILSGEEDRAIELLRRAVAANPGHLFGRGGEVGWQWRQLESHPAFDELRAADVSSGY